MKHKIHLIESEVKDMQPHFWIVTEEGIKEVNMNEYYKYKGEKFVTPTANYTFGLAAQMLLAYR